MKYALLTIKEQRDLQGRQYSESEWLNPTIYNGFIILSEYEINRVTDSDLLYLKDKPLVELSALAKPDTTQPSPMGYGVEIPSNYNNLGFWSTKVFVLNGFEVPLTDYNSGLAVDLAYLLWQDFRDEQDNPVNEALKNELSILWYELKTKAENNDLVQL